MFRARRAERAAPLDGVDVVLADLDGVVYKGSGAIPHAVDALQAFAADGGRVGYITNNASRTDAQVAAHLVELGLAVAPTDVVTSPQAAVRLLAGLVAPGARILVIGGDGLLDEVAKAGFEIVRSADDAPDAVVQGFAPHLGWTDLAEAAFALASGIPWVATNTDWTIPVARGIAPGNGTLVSAVHTAAGRFPVVAGKPETPIFEEAVARFGAASPLFIGDRLDTDILGARRAGIRSALVLTGIDGLRQLLPAKEEMRPDFIVADLRELSSPYPATERRGDVVHVGASAVRVEGTRVSIERAGAPTDLIRAGCAAVWGSGRTVHGLQLPSALMP